MAPLKRSARVRGFTLLELLLASAVMVSIAVLGTALWTQSAGASESAQLRDRGLRLQRLGTMMREQWSQRRVLRPMQDGAQAGVSLGPERMEFVTASPILYPQAPLVRARYEWGGAGENRFDLRYIERPVLEFGEALETEEDQEATALNSRSMVLLEGCDAVLVERFGEAIEESGEGEGVRRPGWHAYATGDEAEADALRLTVRWRGEEAVWVFVARPSR